jgi:small-conductance mechanosensitive channel
MEATWPGRLAAAIGVLWIAIAARGDEPAPAPAAPPAAPPVAAQPGPPGDQAAGAGAAKADAPESSAAARAEVEARLKKLGDPNDKDAPAGSKALREVLQARLDWINEWDKAAKARHEAEHPDSSPDRQAAELKAELERVRARLDRSAKDPDSLLPDSFRGAPAQVSDAARAEMKEALDAAHDELKDWKAKLETVRAEAARKGTGALATLRAERDKLHQRVASLKPHDVAAREAAAAAKSPEAAELAHERLINSEWEARVEAERLLAAEARLALETRRADLVEPHVQALEAHVALAARALERMQARYRSIAERQERDLKRAADVAQERAAKADDPLERYRARRSAELLDLEARAIKDEDALATSPPPSFEEQKGLADRAVEDFEGLKKLLDDGRVSHLDALRLNNDFRRIGPERARIVARELAAVNAQVAYYENALSTVELDLIHDTRDDRLELDRVLETLPKARHDAATALFAEFEKKHEQLLARRRAVLEKLALRAEATHEQVSRRLRTLDDQYGFIRTHIFWVRDEEPIGAATLAQARREALRVGKGLWRMSLEAWDRSLWGRVSAEFAAALLAMVALPWPLLRLGRLLVVLAREPRRAATGPATARAVLIGVGCSAIAPAYLGLVAYLARQGPWPRGLGLLSATALAVLSATGVATNLSRWPFRTSGWAEAVLGMPADVSRQVRRSILVVAAAGVLLLLPEWLLDCGLIAPGGRPVSAASLGRLLILGFELAVWAVAFGLARRRSPLWRWIEQRPERTNWLDRHRRRVCWSAVAAIGGVIALDVMGYSFTARRLAIGAGQSLVLLVLCRGLYVAILRAVDHHAWRWIRAGHSSSASPATADAVQPDDLADRLRRLAGYLVPALGLVAAAWIWGVDWALFRFLGEQPLWLADAKGAGKEPVYATVGDLAQSALILGLCAVAWRHMSTFFAVAVFPRMRDDPGVRFAVLTLCRYAVLGVGLLAGLSAIHLGLEKIGVVLAALGVGLGFGLQEIVSNFVCGIILLLERPIRVGDVVTVSGMTGKVDRINIRATTITNGDNQSIIVPNRGFITSDLVNWTLRDKVIRVTIRIKAAHGTDPDRVSDLLLNVAREDPDVLRNPLPAAFMEDFADSGQVFALHVHVPEPSLGARVRHRLFAQVQRQFEHAGIAIPLPTQELHVKTLPRPADPDALPRPSSRFDPASPTPPSPRLSSQTTHVPEPVEECHRGVDE